MEGVLPDEFARSGRVLFALEWVGYTACDIAKEIAMEYLKTGWKPVRTLTFVTVILITHFIFISERLGLYSTSSTLLSTSSTLQLALEQKNFSTPVKAADTDYVIKQLFWRKTLPGPPGHEIPGSDYSGGHVFIKDQCYNLQDDGPQTLRNLSKLPVYGDIYTHVNDSMIPGMCEKKEEPHTAEVLYNGLCLGSSCSCVGTLRKPTKWPPETRRCFSEHFSTPPFVKYSEPPPSIEPGVHENHPQFCFNKGFKGHGIRNVSVGRQLFVDNFLIRYMSFGIKRIYDTAKWVKSIDMEDENGDMNSILWHKQERRLRMYRRPRLSYMTSVDGVNWSKDVTILHQHNMDGISMKKRDAVSIWFDPFENDQTKQYKAMIYNDGRLLHFTSEDATNFKLTRYNISGFFQDASTLCLNPFRRKWVYFLKANYLTLIRTQLYSEANIESFGNHDVGLGFCPLIQPGLDMNAYTSWKSLGCLIQPGTDTYRPNIFPSPLFMCPDAADADFENTILDKYGKPETYAKKRMTDIYYTVAFAYESVMIAALSIHTKWNSKAPKDLTPHLGFSRDGFHYSRQPPEKGKVKRPNTGYIDVSSIPSSVMNTAGFHEWKPAGNAFVVMGDSIYTYLNHYGYWENYNETQYRQRPGRDSRFLKNFISVFKFRRDGFVYLETREQKQLLVTEILTVSAAKYLFINAKAVSGSLRVQIVWHDGTIFKPWSNEFSDDQTRYMVQWATNVGNTVELLDGKNFVLIFELSDCAFYSFWFSDSESGTSGGHIVPAENDGINWTHSH